MSGCWTRYRIAQIARVSLVSAALVGMGASVGGCSWLGWGKGSQKSALGSDDFYKPAPTPTPSAEDRRTAADASGALAPNAVSPGPARATVSDVNSPRQPNAQQQAQQQQPVRAIAPEVRDVVTPTATAPAVVPTSQQNAAAARTASTTPGVSTAQYMTLGAVVTEVSGTPIYADKVLQQLTPLLSSEAKQRDFQSYKALAVVEIGKQVGVMIRNELEYAAALQNLGKDEKDFADQLTTQWRQRQITEAGGSLQLARRKAAADGLDFDEKVREQYRTFMVQIFYTKKIQPRVMITADELRHYYDQHLKQQFTESDQAQFRLIKITAREMGSKAAAIDKAKQIHDQAATMNDEEFAKLAGSINHDSLLMKNKGRVGTADGWLQKGSFAVQEVEDAVWKLQPGQVSDVIDVNGSTFYVARLENRKLGRVRPFESEDVQKEITETLRRAQIAARREQVQNKLLENAVIYPNPPVIDPVIEMAVQKYPQWHAAAGASTGAVK